LNKFLIYFGVFCLLFITKTTSIPLGINQVITYSYFLIILAILERELRNKDFIFKIKNRLELQYVFLIFIVSFFQFSKGGLFSFYNTLTTLLLPIIILLFLLAIDFKLRNNIFKLIILFFVLECCLAIFEKVLNINVFPEPVSTGDVLNINIQEKWEFRSTSFWGNPLMNANIVSIIMSFIVISKIDFKAKLVFYLLGIFALFSFNARGATLVWTVLSIPFFYKNYKKINLRYKFTFFILTLLLGISIIAILINSDFGGRLFNQNKIIDESALVRSKAIDVFEIISIEDFIFGGVKETFFTENGYINMMLTYGVIQAILLILFQILITLKHIKKYSWIDKFFILLSFLGVGMLNNNLQVSAPFLFFILCVATFQTKKKTELRQNFRNHPIV